MRLDGFEVKIVGSNSEKNNGHVYMEHGRHYSIELRNSNFYPCDADVEIDGKPIRSFRVQAGVTIRVDGPPDETEKFTFFKRDSGEGRRSELNSVRRNDLGLIKVTFKPGKERAVSPPYVSPLPWSPIPGWKYPDYIDHTRDDAPYTYQTNWKSGDTWCTSGYVQIGSSTQTDNSTLTTNYCSWDSNSS